MPRKPLVRFDWAMKRLLKMGLPENQIAEILQVEVAKVQEIKSKTV